MPRKARIDAVVTYANKSIPVPDYQANTDWSIIMPTEKIALKIKEAEKRNKKIAMFHSSP